MEPLSARDNKQGNTLPVHKSLIAAQLRSVPPCCGLDRHSSRSLTPVRLAVELGDSFRLRAVRLDPEPLDDLARESRTIP